MPTKDEPRLTLRLSAEVDASLRAKAATDGVKPSTWAREALEKALGDRGGPSSGNGDEGASTTVVDGHGPTPASSRASSPGAEVLRKVAEVQHHMVTPPMFKCPIPGCGFTAKSPAARCGPHGRIVVPEPV